MKYIVVRAKLYGHLMDMAVLFDDEFVHKDMARGACASLWEAHRTQARVVGAGFYSMSRGEAWGQSESLNIVSRGEDDAAVIKQGKVFVETSESESPVRGETTTAAIVDAKDWPDEPATLATTPKMRRAIVTTTNLSKSEQMRKRFKGKR